MKTIKLLNETEKYYKIGCLGYSMLILKSKLTIDTNHLIHVIDSYTEHVIESWMNAINNRNGILCRDIPSSTFDSREKCPEF